MADRLKLGIRELVEFCCRNGDLGYDNGPGVKALDGLQTHQKIQQRYRDEADAEVAVKLLIGIDDFDIELGGRIDLVFSSATPLRIEEIKTVYAQAAGNEDDAVHWAQLKCYAACYAAEHQLDEVRLSLNLVTLFSQHEQRHSKVFNRADLEAFVVQTLQQYLHWHRLVERQRRITREQARALEFPVVTFLCRQRGAPLEA